MKDPIPKMTISEKIIVFCALGLLCVPIFLVISYGKYISYETEAKTFFEYLFFCD